MLVSIDSPQGLQVARIAARAASGRPTTRSRLMRGTGPRGGCRRPRGRRRPGPAATAGRGGARRRRAPAP
ncbi:MAG: hypothetical protein EPN99_01740 [Frankiales bacterium]|nr:MAG: hypothetical protein EPN99_01740 [Frankiales bacterium]